jgi:hypothetical protein
MLKDAGNIINHTYGYITNFDRIASGLEKSHNIDAFVIAGGTMQERSSVSHLLKHIRKYNRKLFKDDRSHIKNMAARFIHGFQRFDKVLYNNVECFVFGRRKTGYFELANTFFIANLRRGMLLHTLKSEISATPAPHGVL